MTRTARRPKKEFLPATKWSEFQADKPSYARSHGNALGLSSDGGSRVRSAATMEKRREHRRQRRARQKQCFHCRQYGHAVADCPKATEQGVGICFKCGSTEHTSKTCRSRVDSAQGDFPYAKCFICGETGHLSKQCPENPRGIYPQGGCCRLCGSVEHKRSDCPDQSAKSSQEDRSISLRRKSDLESADAVDDDIEDLPPAPVKIVKAKPKVVKF